MTAIVIWGYYEQLTPVQRAVKETLERGGSAGSVLAVLGATAGVILLVYLLTKRQARGAGPRRMNSPKALFRDLLVKLDLAPSQRKLLETMAKDLNLPHPAAMLLSITLFDEYGAKWRERRDAAADRSRTGGLDDAETTLARVRRRLFPGLC